jgi:hypothetical protein
MTQPDDYFAQQPTPPTTPPSSPPPGSPQPPPPPQYGAPGPAPAYPAQGYGPYPGGLPMPQPGAPYGVDQYGRPYSDKSKVVAGVLQIVLGGVGAGRWYTGHYGIAAAQLVTCGGLGIWALIDGIMMLVGNVTDPQGRPLRD